MLSLRSSALCGISAVALAAAVLLGQIGLAQAQGSGMKDMPGMRAAPKAGEVTAAGSGMVTAVDTGQHKVTLDHGPIQAIGRPAMKMTFPAAPSVDLTSVKKGDQVQFTLKGSKNSYMVQSIEKPK
jgi:Cu(I)/Ag(I) efflux system periplasmic protein CusF